MVEPHCGGISSTCSNLRNAAEGDDVVATGEDARLNVHRSSWLVRVDNDSVVAYDRICLVPKVLRNTNHLEGQVPQSLLNCCWENPFHLLLDFCFALLCHLPLQTFSSHLVFLGIQDHLVQQSCVQFLQLASLDWPPPLREAII